MQVQVQVPAVVGMEEEGAGGAGCPRAEHLPADVGRLGQEPLAPLIYPLLPEVPQVRLLLGHLLQQGAEAR